MVRSDVQVCSECGQHKVSRLSNVITGATEYTSDHSQPHPLKVRDVEVNKATTSNQVTAATLNLLFTQNS